MLRQEQGKTMVAVFPWSLTLASKMYIFGGTPGQEDDLNDLHSLSFGSPTKPGRSAPSKPAPRKPAPAPTPASAPAPAPKTAAAPSYTSTAPPDISYDISHPAPAMRKRVSPTPIGDVAPRDFERVRVQMIQGIEDIFKKIQAEYQQVSAFAFAFGL